MPKCFEKAAPPQTRRCHPDRDITGGRFGLKHPQHCRFARFLKVINQIVDACRESIGIDLHGRELRPQRGKALAEALAEVLELCVF